MEELPNNLKVLLTTSTVCKLPFRGRLCTQYPYLQTLLCEEQHCGIYLMWTHSLMDTFKFHHITVSSGRKHLTFQSLLCTKRLHCITVLFTQHIPDTYIQCYIDSAINNLVNASIHCQRQSWKGRKETSINTSLVFPLVEVSPYW